MRNIICLVFLLVCVTGKCFGQLQPKVDERIELTGVVFRIAGVPEYTYGVIEEYNKDIDEYFQSYSHHDLIDYIITALEFQSVQVAGFLSATDMFSCCTDSQIHTVE